MNSAIRETYQRISIIVYSRTQWRLKPRLLISNLVLSAKDVILHAFCPKYFSNHHAFKEVESIRALESGNTDSSFA